MKRATFWKIALIVGCHTFSQVDAMEIEKTGPTTAPQLLQAQLQAELYTDIVACSSYGQKLELVSALPYVKDFFNKNPALEAACNQLPQQGQYLVKAVVAIGQGPTVFQGFQEGQSLEHFVEQLEPTERFYSYMGGIVGYHVKTLQLMQEQLENNNK